MTRLNGSMSVTPQASNGSDSSILQSTFSDIQANLLTAEFRCNAFIEYYKKLQLEQKARFLIELAKVYGIEKNSVVGSASNIIQGGDKGEANFYMAAERMRMSLRPRYKTLFVHLGRIPEGVKFLVDMRADVLSLRQSTSDELHAALYQDLNNSLRELLVLWFTVGFLNLERITWNSPCDLVQKVSNYEAVHRIRTWEDIKRRVGPYRRCYIFTHNSMPREPVVVLHTALTNEISSSIHSIIQSPRFRQSIDEEPSSSEYYSLGATSPVTPTSPTIQGINRVSSSSSLSSSSSAPTITSTTGIEEEREDINQISCAVFYSITSTQKGLQGIDMGNYLIKAVVRKLQEEFLHLQQFSSLSPIPGFREWLLMTVNQSISKRNCGEDPGVPVLEPDEITALAAYKLPSHSTPLDTFKEQLTTHEWYRNKALTQVMKGPLLRLCAHYLYLQKRRNYALNPVANFHLSNGAELWRINFLADTSHRGLNQSCSLMVNYRYFLNQVEFNSRNYLENHQIAVSQHVLNILKDPGSRL